MFDRDARKYTATPHPAGSGFDYITALQVKSQWERSLGLPTSGSDENIYEAGSAESQSRVYDGMGKLGVWIDTVGPPAQLLARQLTDSTIL
jgi:N-acetylated-alpha-linked acidic dipeptidase